MEKISSNDAKALLKQAAASIRTLVDENTALREKLASKETDERIKKLASEMEAKSLSPELSYEEKVASLRNSKLDVAEQAIKMASPQGFNLGTLGDSATGSGDGNAESAFNTFVMTGETQ